MKDKNYCENHKDTIIWHSKVKGCSFDKVVSDWQEKGVDEKIAWKQFKDYLFKYHQPAKRRSMFSAPMAAGYNILNFDMIITDRLAIKYDDTTTDKRQNNIFYPRDKLDLLYICYLWFSGMEDGPKSYTMDSMRAFLEMSGENAHDAKQDVIDTAEILIRFMKIHRRFAKKVGWNKQHKQRLGMPL